MNGENIMNKKEELKIVNKETFKRLVYEKSFEKYGQNIQTRIKERIDKELSMV
jgi:DNA polymerase III alpha subunit (gram-positive type)